MSEKQAQLNEQVLALSAKLEVGMDLDAKTGVGTEKGNLYNENLPADLTPEVVKSVTNYNTTFVAAGTHAFGKLAVEAMKGNSGLDVATMEIKMGDRDKLSVSTKRVETKTDHLHGGGEVTKYGVTTTGYEVRAGKNAGQLKVARSLIGDLATAALSK